MPNADDRRVKMTKKILKEALIEIMHTKPIHEISIKKICETADVNRSTFYHHYQSPQELYDDIINDLSQEFNEILGNALADGCSQSELITRMLTLIESKKELFLVILSDRGNIGIGEKLSNIMCKFIGADQGSELSMYCAQFISAGVANILWLWLNNENRMPPKAVSDLITTITNHGIKKAVAFSNQVSFFNI